MREASYFTIIKAPSRIFSVVQAHRLPTPPFRHLPHRQCCQSTLIDFSALVNSDYTCPPIPYSQGRRLRCTADIVIKGASGWSTPRLEFNLRLTCERRSRDGLIESSEHVIVDISGLVASRIGRRQRDFRHQADIWRSDVTGIYYKICLYYIVSCPCGLYT